MSEATLDAAPLPVGSIGRGSFGWWGVLCLIATEGALLGYLLFCYFYACVQLYGSMAPPGRPPLHLVLPMTGALILNSVALWWAERGIKRDALWQLLGGVAIALLLGVAFIILEIFEWLSKPFTPRSNPYGSAYFGLTGVHLLHVIAGVAMLVLLLIWSGLGYFNSRRNVPVLVITAYWHFINVSWIIYFLALYAAPYLQ